MVLAYSHAISIRCLSPVSELARIVCFSSLSDNFLFPICPLFSSSPLSFVHTHSLSPLMTNARMQPQLNENNFIESVFTTHKRDNEITSGFQFNRHFRFELCTTCNLKQMNSHCVSVCVCVRLLIRAMSQSALQIIYYVKRLVYTQKWSIYR